MAGPCARSHARERSEAPAGYPRNRTRDLLELARSIGDRASEAEILRQRARDGLTAGLPMDDVLADYSLAESLLRDLEARSPLVLTLQEHARVLREKGREDEAAPIVAEEERLRSEMGLPAPLS